MRRAHPPAISALRTARFTRFFVVPLTLLALFSGCYKWTTVAEPGRVDSASERAGAVLALELPSRVRVTYDMAGVETIVILQSASVVGDSLIGATFTRERRFEDVRDPTGPRVAIPLTDITRIERREKDQPRTALLSIGLLAGATVLFLAVACLSGDEPDMLGCWRHHHAPSSSPYCSGLTRTTWLSARGDWPWIE